MHEAIFDTFTKAVVEAIHEGLVIPGDVALEATEFRGVDRYRRGLVEAIKFPSFGSDKIRISVHAGEGFGEGCK